MSEINPPAWEQAGSYQAQQDRMALCAMLTPGPAIGPFSPLGGVRPDSNGLAVTALGTPGMAVSVASGTAWVPATIPLNAGWTCHNNGARNVTIAAASPSNPRIDLIIAHCYDATDDIGSLSQWNLEAVTGTPASSPVAPAAPTNSIIIAQVTVPTGATAITSGNIADKRTWMVALGGILPATSSTLPASPYPGQAAYCADTGEVVVYQASTAPNSHTWQSAAAGPGPWISSQGVPLGWSSGPGWQAAGTGWPSMGFIVPRSGQVFISLTAGPGNSGSDIVAIGWSMSGTDTIAHSLKNAVVSQDGSLVQATIRRLITGLTPGGNDILALQTFYNIGSPMDNGLGELVVEAVP